MVRFICWWLYSCVLDFLLKQKFGVSNVFSNFHNMIKTQFGVRIKKFKFDNAKDYFNQVLSPYF